MFWGPLPAWGYVFRWRPRPDGVGAVWVGCQTISSVSPRVFVPTDVIDFPFRDGDAASRCVLHRGDGSGGQVASDIT